MTDSEALARLERVQNQLLGLIRGLDEQSLRIQLHPELSPLGWHLGHCAFVERLWVREELLGLDEPETRLRELYLPENSAKVGRGARLPDAGTLLAWAEQSFAAIRALLDEPATAVRPELLRDAFLPRFLTQHHAQHLETMRMALAQRRLAGAGAAAAVAARSAAPEWVTVPAGDYRIGSDRPDGFDNERPARRLRLPRTRIARRVVDNAHYLAFIEAGGYRDRRWWCEAGWNWLQRAAHRQPEHWEHGAGGWLEHGPEGPRELRAEAPLSGVSLYEARAFAAWAGARLPHEYEWEAAARLGLLEDSGQVWEWCGNRFHPYPGFRPFPYQRYSVPWFDGRHYVLRGGSRHTLACVRRPSFRNFYTAEQRHIFAGIRLAM